MEIVDLILEKNAQIETLFNLWMDEQKAKRAKYFAKANFVNWLKKNNAFNKEDLQVIWRKKLAEGVILKYEKNAGKFYFG